MRGRLWWIGLIAWCGFLATPAPCQEAAVPAEVRARQLIEDLRAGRFQEAEATFDLVMRTALPLERLQQVWQEISTQFGALETTGAVKGDPREGGFLFRIPLHFAEGDLLAQIFVNAAGEVGGLYFAPAPPEGPSALPGYADTTRYHEVPLALGPEGRTLPGTLTIPRAAAGPAAAVILLHGSGPNDRDESVGANKPFRDLAAGLATRGIAVYRYEKRTRIYPRAFDPMATTVEEEALADARAAVTLLAGRPEIDPSRIFVLGHSLGGVLAPILAGSEPRVRGIALYGASARPLLVVIADQFRHLASLESDSLRATMLRGKADEALALLGTDLPDSTMVLGMPLRYIRDLEARDPLGTAARLGIPILVMQGGRDYQCTIREFDLWQAALAQHAATTFRLFEDLNHLMIAGKGPSGPEEYLKAGNVDRRVIEAVADWIEAAR